MVSLRFPFIVSLSSLLFFLSITAHAQSFSDVPSTHPAYAAIEFLKERGILQGYSDGTFKPGTAVKRAEALKVIVALKVSPAELAKLSGSNYDDVPADAWYYPYVQAGHQTLKIIDGPPTTTVFNGSRTVNRVEFLKMFFLSQGVNTGAFGEIQLPMGNDVTSPTEWYYPLIRYAFSASMIQVDTSGNLSPAQELTRGDMAVLMHRFAMYQAGRRTQALLSEEESELVNVLDMLEKNEIVQAEYASARALIAARGAHASKPDVPLVQGALKIAEAFRALVRGYRAGVEGKLDEVVSLSKEAWNIAESAKSIIPDLGELAGSVQSIAGKMANEARQLQAPQ